MHTIMWSMGSCTYKGPVTSAMTNGQFFESVTSRGSCLKTLLEMQVCNTTSVIFVQLSLNSALRALLCSLKAYFASCFDADSMLSETKRDRGTNSVWQQLFSLTGIRHGTSCWGEDECCDKVNRTEGKWGCLSMIV